MVYLRSMRCWWHKSFNFFHSSALSISNPLDVLKRKYENTAVVIYNSFPPRNICYTYLITKTFSHKAIEIFNNIPWIISTCHQLTIIYEYEKISLWLFNETQCFRQKSVLFLNERYFELIILSLMFLEYFDPFQKKNCPGPKIKIC